MTTDKLARHAGFSVRTRFQQTAKIPFLILVCVSVALVAALITAVIWGLLWVVQKWTPAELVSYAYYVGALAFIGLSAWLMIRSAWGTPELLPFDWVPHVRADADVAAKILFGRLGHREETLRGRSLEWIGVGAGVALVVVGFGLMVLAAFAWMPAPSAMGAWDAILLGILLATATWWLDDPIQGMAANVALLVVALGAIEALGHQALPGHQKAACLSAIDDLRYSGKVVDAPAATKKSTETASVPDEESWDDIAWDEAEEDRFT